MLAVWAAWVLGAVPRHACPVIESSTTGRRLPTQGLGLLALGAGVGEETLFRGFLQSAAVSGLAGALPGDAAVAAGLTAVAVVFGALHALTPSYFLFATAAGFVFVSASGSAAATSGASRKRRLHTARRGGRCIMLPSSSGASSSARHHRPNPGSLAACRATNTCSTVCRRQQSLTGCTTGQHSSS